MKKWILSLGTVVALSACAPATTTQLRPGEIMGTEIGTVLSSEAGLDLSKANLDKMNSEIDKALFFSDDGLTTRWYAGYNVRLRPLANQRDRRDRECRRFRHGHMLDGEWMNATAVACREKNVAWYLIANQWDNSQRGGRRDYFDDRDSNRDWDQGRGFDNTRTDKGQWQNLGDALSGNVPSQGNDDFGAGTRW